MPDTFHCTLVTPEQQLFDDAVSYASIPAWDGQVGLMHLRAPLLAKLGDGPLRLDLAKGGTRWFFIAGGFAQMKDDKLTLLTEEAVPAENIKVADAQASLREAQAQVAVGEEDIARKNRRVRRAAAMIEIHEHHGSKG